MAIREVLSSFTFEQQRQEINLIGADIGDASLLVTPSKVLSTSINQVVAGFVTLSGQTIQLEDGTSVAPSLSFDSQTNLGIYKQGTDTLGVNKNLFVGGNLTVDGDITFRAGNGSGGTLTFGDLDTDNIVLNADLNSHIIPNTDNTFDLGTASKEWRNIWIDGTATIDSLQVDETATVTGNLAVNSGNITTTSGVVNLFNNTAATVFAFGEATNIKMGELNSAFEVGSSVVRSTATSLQLYNVNTTSVTAFSVASGIAFGYAAPSGVPNTNFTVRSDDTILDGDLNVNGGEILSSQNTFKLLTNNSDVRIGAAGGSTVINNSLKVNGATFDLTNQGVTISVKDNLNPALKISEGANDYISIQTTDTLEKVIFHKDVSFTQNVSFADNDFLYLGNSNDLAIYHDGTDSYVRDQGTGNLYIQGTNNVSIRKDDGSKTMAVFTSDGSSELHFNNSKKIETSSTGITVTGRTLTGSLGAGTATTTGNAQIAIVTVSGTTASMSIGQNVDGTGSSHLGLWYGAAGASANIFTSNGNMRFDVDGNGISTGSSFQFGKAFGAGGASDTWLTVASTGVTITGNLIVNGTTTTINSTVLSIDDTAIVLADGATTPALANGAGITLGTTGISLTYSNVGTRWSSTENFTVASGRTYQIDGNTVLSSTAVLGRTPGGTVAGDIVTIDGTQTLTNKAYGQSSTSVDADVIIDAGAFSYFSYIQSVSGTARTINVSNLSQGRMITIYLRNTNAASKTINIAASTIASGFTAVNLSKGDAGGTSVTSVTLAATSGTAVVTLFTAGGTIGGCIS